MSETSSKNTLKNATESRISLDAKGVAPVKSQTLVSNYSPSPSGQSKSSLLETLKRPWSNMSLQIKLTFLLIAGAAVPVIVVSQGLISISQKYLISDMGGRLLSSLTLLEQIIEREKDVVATDAQVLAGLVEAAEVDVNNPDQVSEQLSQLQALLKKTVDTNPGRSFYIITDARGKTIAQSIQAIEAVASYPPLPIKGRSQEQKLLPVSRPSGISLDDVPIVKNVLDTKKPLVGTELLKGEYLQRLGLEQQGNIGLRTQKILGLPDAKKPFPEGTYDIDRGRLGLAIVAVRPIQVQDNLVGTAIVGTLINRNYKLVDLTKEEVGITTATIFARDWRVSTNVPYTDGKTRAIGTRASREVADTVLNRGQDYIGEANIVGTDYLTGYRPLYDHQKQLNPSQAKPIGMAYVGDPQIQMQAALKDLALTGYGLGGGILLLVSLITPAVAGSIADPMRRLADFAQQVGAGKRGSRLENTEREDEIGILSQKMNQMVASLEEKETLVRQQAEQNETLLRQQAEANETILRQQAEQAEELAKEQRQLKEDLQQQALELLKEVDPISKGDLTIRAKVTSDEIGTIADSYNATVANLRKIVIQVQQAASQVAETTSINEVSIEALSTEALRQAEEIAQALKRAQEMAELVRVVAANAEQAEAAVRQAAQTVEEGDIAMNRTVDGIMSIRETVAETAKKVKHLGESSQKISAVVNLIGSFASQTNLLALNATIEAARAGEEGRGFAVVAEQVRSLARQSAEATGEIEKLVAAIQAETNEVVTAMESGTEQVVMGTRLVDETRQSLNKITAASDQINQLVAAIAQATIMQSQASEAVTRTMTDVAALAQQTSREASSVSSSFGQLRTVAQTLQENVGQFKV